MTFLRYFILFGACLGILYGLFWAISSIEDDFKFCSCYGIIFFILSFVLCTQSLVGNWILIDGIMSIMIFLLILPFIAGAINDYRLGKEVQFDYRKDLFKFKN